MAFLFKKKKTPSELAAILARDLAAFSTHASDEKAVEKLQTDVAKRINQMRDVVYGEVGQTRQQRRVSTHTCAYTLVPFALCVGTMLRGANTNYVNHTHTLAPTDGLNIPHILARFRRKSLKRADTAATVAGALTAAATRT